MIATQRLSLHRSVLSCSRSVRWNSSGAIPSAYADKLKARLAREGTSTIEELKTKLKNEGRAFVDPPMNPIKPRTASEQTAPMASSTAPKKAPRARSSRKDSAPVTPLSDLLNLSAIASKPHTVEQITALWTLYHASRSSGTGRGYVSAVVPLKTYETMLERAKRWPMFVLPIPRPSAPGSPGETPKDAEQEAAMEFHLLQWGLHGPPTPELLDPFDRVTIPAPTPTPLPHITTVLFTSLIEYQRHQTYAPPYFVTTFYTHFAASHGIVLLRGEITPRSRAGPAATTPSGDEKYMLSQMDAQLLAMGLQRFYLPQQKNEGGSIGGEEELLLKTFNEKPSEFKWQDLVAAWKAWGI